MRLSDVFGIGAKKLETYVERGADDDFKRCLQGRQHIVLHGSSKQGKTSLLFDRGDVAVDALTNVTALTLPVV